MTSIPTLTPKGFWNAIYGPGNVNSFTLDMTRAFTGGAVAVGDWMFFTVAAPGSAASSRTPSLPAGFIEIVPWSAMGTSTTSMYAIWAKQRLTGETSYTAALDNSAGHTIGTTFRALWYEGTELDPTFANWQIGVKQSRATSGGTNVDTAPSVNTTVDNSLCLAFFTERTTAADTDAGHTISGTGWTKAMNTFLEATAGDATFDLASKGLAAHGASGNVSRTCNNTQATNGAALQVIIPPMPDAPPEGYPGYWWDGSDVLDGEWFIMGDDEPESCSWAGMIWPGYGSIADMLADNPFYCGHRGGSRNWPEMSLQGYTQAALRGYGALEISLARTSDGKWFGLHDASLDRTSLGTGGGSGTTLVASAMTWAQVQTYDLLPAVGAPVNALHQPYMLLDEILDAYLDSHVLFIDPKAALAYRNELITILQNRPEWQDKIVAKYVPGNSTNSWLTAARTAGFVTNAMFYDTDTSPNYSQADILGYNYNANISYFTAALATGKPVMCHVCPDSASVATGLGKGATGAMVSGPVQVPLVTMP